MKRSLVEFRAIITVNCENMGQLENQSDNMKPEDPNATEELLRSMTHELQSLQQDLVTQLHQDIRRLQAEKSRLINDIEKLQNQQQSLQSQHEVNLSRQQLAQQQAWAKQLALALANHLHTALTQRLSQTLSTQQLPRAVDMSQIVVSQADTENTYRLLASIDETLNRTFTSLHHDLNSYQSAISQQLGRMHDLGQQGEAILDVLVNRISQQLQSEVLKQRENRVDRPAPASIPPAGEPGYPPAVGYPATASTAVAPPASAPPPGAVPPGAVPPAVPAAVPPVVPPQGIPPIATTPPPLTTPVPGDGDEDPAGRSAPRQASSFQLGVVLILFSTLTLALHYVGVQVIGTQGRLLGNAALQIGGYLNLTSFSSALLLFWVRMIAVVPLMVWLSGLLYPPVWRDIKALMASKDRRILWSLIGSGVFLLLSQVFLYIAIAETVPAIAVTLSSVYSLLMVPLTWFLFRDRPPRPRVIALLLILVGIIFTLFSAPGLLSSQGLVAALVSGATLALYLVSMMLINRRKLNPVPISLIQNATMFVLSSAFLIGGGTEMAPTNWTGLIIGGLILGGLTIISYALNDFGSRMLGAARATIIASSIPMLTALLAFVILPAANSLSLGQIVGIFVVTLGTVTLGFERVLNQYKNTMRRSNRPTG